MSYQLTWLDENDNSFPDPALALSEPNGLLAAGGQLSTKRLIEAYKLGIFPWYEAGQPVLWWSPDPRMVLFPDELHVSKSLRKVLDRKSFTVTSDTAFAEVIAGCAERPGQAEAGTWITADMEAAYRQLHDEGYAHSVESWAGTELAGGLYGVALGKVFFGESMFSRRANASKVAFIHLVTKLQQSGYRLIDCQITSRHLASLGAREIPRSEFMRYLPGPGLSRPGAWKFNAEQ